MAQADILLTNSISVCRRIVRGTITAPLSSTPTTLQLFFPNRCPKIEYRHGSFPLPLVTGHHTRRPRKGGPSHNQQASGHSASRLGYDVPHNVPAPFDISVRFRTALVPTPKSARAYFKMDYVNGARSQELPTHLLPQCFHGEYKRKSLPRARLLDS